MNSEVDFRNLISITSAGLKVASFSEILDYLTIKYKEAFGDDIQITNQSADGIFLYNTALCINNILQCINTMYSNWNVNEATGTALDNLCTLSNIFRKGATHSTAKVRLLNYRTSDVALNSVEAVDKSGLVWRLDKNIVVPAATHGTVDTPNPIEVTLTCEEPGYIKAEPGWIYQLINLPSPYNIISVEQDEAAIPGQDIESDENLRARKNESNSPVGITVLDSLVGALLQIDGVQDAIIYNKVTSTSAKDLTPINAHDIYVVARYNDSSNDDSINDDIANTIFQKLTPGVMTTPVVASTPEELTDTQCGVGRSKQISPDIYGISDAIYSTNIYWKKASPVHPTITITFKDVLPLYYNASFATEIIGKGLIEYLNHLQLSSNISSDEIMTQAYSLDPRYTGKYDFTVESVVIDEADNNDVFTNQDTYYNYSTCATSVGNDLVLTIQ